VRALQLFGPDDLRVVDLPVADIGPDDALLEVESAGLCGTEPGIYHRGQPRGLVPGHEYAGTVARVGSRVTRVKVGDRVTGLWHSSCGACVECRAGMPELCPVPMTFGHAFDGSYAEYMRVPNADRCLLRLGDSLPFDLGALMGCSLVTAMWALARAGVVPGDSVAVFGLGAVGLCGVLGARLAGARTVIGLDPVAYRRATALECGADQALDPTDAGASETLRSCNGGAGTDRAIIPTTAKSAPQQALEGTRRGGTVVVIGGVGDFTINSRQLNHEQKTLTGAAGAPGADFGQRVVDLVADGRLDAGRLSRLVTHRFALADAATAFQVYEAKSEPVIKAVIHP